MYDMYILFTPTSSYKNVSSEYQHLRAPVISAFSTLLGTREDSVISAFSTLLGTREDSVISASGTLGTRKDSVISAFSTLGTGED